MTKTNFNEKPHFPYTYGDLIEDDGVRLSDHVVNVAKSERFKNHLVSVAGALVTIGFYAAPVSAIPPEYGEAVNDLVNNMDQVVPPLGNPEGVAGIAANGMNVGQRNPVPNNLGQIGQAGRVNLNNPHIPPVKPIKVPAWRLPPSPVTPAGQYANTILLVGSIGWICLNGAWGNPIFMTGCVGILTGLANEARKIIFK